MRKRLWLAALAAVSAAGSASASAAPSPPQFPALYAFGDSLSDAGNAYIETGGTTPMTPPYASVNGYGVFSNGPLWVQHLSQELDLGVLAPSLAGGTDFAIGGTQSGPAGAAYSGAPGDLLPSASVPLAQTQLGMFQAAVPAPKAGALYTLSIGSNDLRTILTNDPTHAAADAAQVIGNIATFIGALAADGAKNFLVVNVPDLGKTPALQAFGPTVAAEATALAASFDAGLAAELNVLSSADLLNLHVLDAFSLVDEAVASPTSIGLTNATDACVNAAQGTVCADPSQYLFWDTVHPTEIGQMALAGLAEQAVPEPSTLALMAGGLLLLDRLRRRRVSMR